MSWLVDGWVVVTVAAGVVFFVAGTLGLLRFPDSMTRLHALTKADNLGLGLVVLGMMGRASGPWEGLKLAGVWLVVLVASATLAQLIAEKVRVDRSPPEKSPAEKEGGA